MESRAKLTAYGVRANWVAIAVDRPFSPRRRRVRRRGRKVAAGWCHRRRRGVRCCLVVPPSRRSAGTPVAAELVEHQLVALGAAADLLDGHDVESLHDLRDEGDVTHVSAGRVA